MTYPATAFKNKNLTPDTKMLYLTIYVDGMLVCSESDPIAVRSLLV